MGLRAFPLLLSWTLCLLCVKLVYPPLCSKGVFLGALISSSHGKPTWIWSDVTQISLSPVSRTLVLRVLKKRDYYYFITIFLPWKSRTTHWLQHLLLKQKYVYLVGDRNWTLQNSNIVCPWNWNYYWEGKMWLPWSLFCLCAFLFVKWTCKISSEILKMGNRIISVTPEQFHFCVSEYSKHPHTRT